MSAFPYGIRAREGQALSLDEMRAKVPALFADQPHESRSERYVFIPTDIMLGRIIDAGFDPVEVRQGRVRDESRREYTKHMVRFRHRTGIDLHNKARHGRAVGDTALEVIMKGSHDGSTAYDFMAGLFRLACLNGMVVADSTIASVHVRHSGNRDKIISNVIDASYEVVNQGQKALEAPRLWSGIELNRDERMAFAESARVVRFGDSEGKVETPITAEQMLVPRRPNDTGNDLWRTFNVLQENSIRGGLTARGFDANNRPRRTTTREVRGIDQDVKLNRALWLLAENMAKLKAA